MFAYGQTNQEASERQANLVRELPLIAYGRKIDHDVCTKNEAGHGAFR